MILPINTAYEGSVSRLCTHVEIYNTYSRIYMQNILPSLAPWWLNGQKGMCF